MYVMVFAVHNMSEACQGAYVMMKAVCVLCGVGDGGQC